MKAIFVCMLLIASQSFAAEIRLSSGDSVLVAPNSPTRVTCDGGGNSSVPSCKEVKAGLAQLIDACKTSYTAAFCTDKYVPKFKAQHPACADAVLDLCLAGCQTSYTAAFCADRCSQ